MSAVGGWIIVKGLRWLGNKTTGYKTKVAGVLSILNGLAGIAGIIWPDVKTVDLTFEQSMGFIIGGLATIGIGGKLDRVNGK